MSDQLRVNERESIRNFIENSQEYIQGNVLDYGCGKQPYKNLVESFGANYWGYDEPRFPGSTVTEEIWPEGCPQYNGLGYKKWDTILCNQVIQYQFGPSGFLAMLSSFCKLGGHLVMTYPTHWPEVESDDLFRFTKNGMDKMLAFTGWKIMRHDLRHYANMTNHQSWEEEIAIGYGVVARAFC